MTILAAACATIDDLVDSGSFLRTQVSACDYGILDTCGTCAVIVRPGNSSFDLIGYGGVSNDYWGLTAEGYVRDTGDVIETMSNVYHIIDALIGAIKAGSNGNTATRISRVTNISHNPDAGWISPGGNDFLRVSATIRSSDDP